MVYFGPKPAQLRDLRAAFTAIPRALRLVWQAHKPSAAGMTIAALVGALIPAGQAWVGKLIVDTIVQTAGGQTPLQEGLRLAAPYILLEFVLFVLSSVISESRMLLERILSSRLRHTMNAAIIRQSLALDLQYFEDADFYDKLQNARQETQFRAITILQTTFVVLQNTISLISFIVILLTFNPLIALILFGASLPAFIAQIRYSDMYFLMQSGRAPEVRRMNYLEYILTVDSTVKEIKLFGLGEPLLKRYEDLFWKFYREDTALARWRSSRSFLWGLLATLSYYAAYAWIVWRALHGVITLGDMTLYITLFRQSQATVQGLFGNLGQVYECGRFMENLFSFLQLRPQMIPGSERRPIPRPIRQGIEFRGVSFRYPNRKNWVLHDVNLFIAPGEKLALVGANGAGKTTLVKLLTRLYDPTEGQILLDGVDLREYDLDDLRRCIGVIFQDFVRYYATARENIGFGQIESIDDEERIKFAAERGGADQVIEQLPDGYDSMLGNWFEKGLELSGGQWQKMALARAFMRDGEVLVLDEPTAALDAEREHEIFQRFRDLTEGRIAVLISHRFSTVRMADHIVVIEDGRVTEHGTHEDLLEHDGLYARLFDMQAAGYR